MPDAFDPPKRGREAMLEELLAAMAGLHRRRRRRVAGAALLLLVAIGGVWMAGPLRGRSEQFAVGPGGNHGEPPRTVIPDQKRAGLIREIDDAELIEILAEIGRPAGLIRTGSSVRLTEAVTDAELENFKKSKSQKAKSAQHT